MKTSSVVVVGMLAVLTLANTSASFAQERMKVEGKITEYIVRNGVVHISDEKKCWQERPGLRLVDKSKFHPITGKRLAEPYRKPILPPNKFRCMMGDATKCY